MRRLSALTVAILASTGAAASGFQLNNPEINAMGGAGVSSSAFANPALITSNRGTKGFDLTLGSASFYIEDPKGFGEAVRKFVEEDLETYETFEYDALNNSLATLSQAAAETAIAAEEFQNEPESETKLNALIDAQVAQQNATIAARADIDAYNGLVSNTQDSFEGFSNRPVNFGLLTGLGLQMPRNGVPFSVAVSNNTYGGAQFQLERSDLDNLSFVLSDMSQYLGQVSEVNTALENLVIAAEDLQEKQTLENQQAFEEALEAFSGDDDADNNGAVGNLDTFDSTNGLFVNGDVDDQAAILSFNEEDTKSTIDILGANISELAFGSGIDYPNDLGNLSIGATAKLQYWQVFGETIGYEDRNTVDGSFIQNNTQAYFTGNLDLGIAQSFTGTGYGTFGVAAVVKDLVPQSFESGDGRTIDVGPKLRAGVSHQTRFTLLTADIDVTENAPIGHGVDSRYLGLGAQLNAWDYAQLRVGYRNNLSVSDASIVSAGIGLTPWVAALDISGWVKPNAEDEIDLALNAGFSMDLGIRF